MNPLATQTVGMLVYRKDFNEILLTKHKDTAKHQTGKYGIPAGRVEPGETEVQCLLREFNQETGLVSTESNVVKLPFEYSAVIERKGEQPRLFGLRVWFCKNYTGTIKEQEENIPEWVSVEKLGSYDLLPNMEKVVIDSLTFIRSNRV